MVSDLGGTTKRPPWADVPSSMLADNFGVAWETTYVARINLSAHTEMHIERPYTHRDKERDSRDAPTHTYTEQL
jgi:hypothetical protein